ncbi:MAG: ATP phosphoribosyltransferase regulatory subunit, partial [Porcipelethomonas sp.]
DFGYDVPATGFAVNVDAVMTVEMKKNELPEKNIDAVVYAEAGHEINALKTANKLRSEGKTVEISLFDTFEKTVNYAEKKNIAHVIKAGETAVEVK